MRETVFGLDSNDAYLDRVGADDLPVLVAEIRKQRLEISRLREALRSSSASPDADLVSMALHMGAKKMREAACKVAEFCEAKDIASAIEGLPLPGQNHLGGYNEH